MESCFFSCSGSGAAAVTHRAQKRSRRTEGHSSTQPKTKHNKQSGSRVLTAVATGDSSMSRCGLMELMFQGARPVGSGVGIPGPISSLESIPGPRCLMKSGCVRERSGPERCRVSMRWSRSPSGPSSSPPCSHAYWYYSSCGGVGKKCSPSLSVSRPIPAPGMPLSVSVDLCM